MALVIHDRVRETSTTTGTGNFTLAGAVQGFETFSSAIGNGIQLIMQSLTKQIQNLKLVLERYQQVF